MTKDDILNIFNRTGLNTEVTHDDLMVVVTQIHAQHLKKLKEIDVRWREQQRINNQIFADKCDEMDKLAEKHKQQLKPLLEVYEEYRKKPITDCSFYKLWQAIKTIAEGMNKYRGHPHFNVYAPPDVQ